MRKYGMAKWWVRSKYSAGKNRGIFWELKVYTEMESNMGSQCNVLIGNWFKRVGFICFLDTCFQICRYLLSKIIWEIFWHIQYSKRIKVSGCTLKKSMSSDPDICFLDTLLQDPWFPYTDKDTCFLKKSRSLTWEGCFIYIFFSKFEFEFGRSPRARACPPALFSVNTFHREKYILQLQNVCLRQKKSCAGHVQASFHTQ